MKLADPRDVISEIGNLCVVHGREHRGHDAVIAMPDVVSIFTKRLREKILTLVGDVRNVFAAGQIRRADSSSRARREPPSPSIGM